MSRMRSDAVVPSLPEAQTEQIRQWLVDGKSFGEVQRLAQKEFGLRVKSTKPFRTFWERIVSPSLIQNLDKAETLRIEIQLQVLRNGTLLATAALKKGERFDVKKS